MLKLTFIGNLACDCELRTYQQTPYYYMRVAVNTSKEHAEFITCFISWDIKKLQPYLVKGSSVYIDGFPTINTYTDREGKTTTRFEVNVNNIELITSKANLNQNINQ